MKRSSRLSDESGRRDEWKRGKNPSIICIMFPEACSSLLKTHLQARNQSTITERTERAWLGMMFYENHQWNSKTKMHDVHLWPGAFLETGFLKGSSAGNHFRTFCSQNCERILHSRTHEHMNWRIAYEMKKRRCSIWKCRCWAIQRSCNSRTVWGKSSLMHAAIYA